MQFPMGSYSNKNNSSNVPIMKSMFLSMKAQFACRRDHPLTGVRHTIKPCQGLGNFQEGLAPSLGWSQRPGI